MKPWWYIANDGVLRLGETWTEIRRIPAGTGAEIDYQLPGGWWYRIRCAAVSLDTSAQAGQRRVRFLITDGNVPIFYAFCDNWQNPNTGNNYNLAAMSAYEFGNLTAQFAISIPDMWLPPGARIKTNTLQLQSGDFYTQMNILCERVDRDTLNRYMHSRLFSRLAHMQSATPPA